MRKYLHRLVPITTVLAALAPLTMLSNAADPRPTKSGKAKPLTRIFVQDLDKSALRWADVRIDEKSALSFDPLVPVEGFKQLDSTRQKLVQMKESGGLICVGVRDDDDGSFESGWALIRTGVGYIDHGDHGHWNFKKRPAVIDSRLDAKQGNPAHLYVYDGRFFLANDRLNGYTRIDPAKYEEGESDKPRFLLGGGNHITLAVVDDKVGYSAWIDGGGPNKGRVDVTPIGPGPRSEPAYSFHLPTGGIHGAIANSGKVFFAPQDGICWVDADLQLKQKPDQIKIRHIPLGKDDDKPRRTGAFVNHGSYVLFVTGKEAGTALVLLDAKQTEPQPITVSLDVKKGNKASTPIIAVTREKKAYAFIFHDHAKDVEADDLLQIVDLDPNGDGNCSDARVLKTLKVGKSAVEGHFGHHDLDFDADRRFGFFTNPGDGTIAVLSLKTLEVVATFKVGGKPTALVTHGGGETHD